MDDFWSRQKRAYQALLSIPQIRHVLKTDAALHFGIKHFGA